MSEQSVEKDAEALKQWLDRNQEEVKGEPEDTRQHELRMRLGKVTREMNEAKTKGPLQFIDSLKVLTFNPETDVLVILSKRVMDVEEQLVTQKIVKNILGPDTKVLLLDEGTDLAVVKIQENILEKAIEEYTKEHIPVLTTEEEIFEHNRRQPFHQLFFGLLPDQRYSGETIPVTKED